MTLLTLEVYDRWGGKVCQLPEGQRMLHSMAGMENLQDSSQRLAFMYGWPKSG